MKGKKRHDFLIILLLDTIEYNSENKCYNPTVHYDVVVQCLPVRKSPPRRDHCWWSELGPILTAKQRRDDCHRGAFTKINVQSRRSTRELVKRRTHVNQNLLLSTTLTSQSDQQLCWRPQVQLLGQRRRGHWVLDLHTVQNARSSRSTQQNHWQWVKNSGPVLSRLWTKVHEILRQRRRRFVVNKALVRYSMSRVVQQIFANKSRSCLKTEEM